MHLTCKFSFIKQILILVSSQCSGPMYNNIFITLRALSFESPVTLFSQHIANLQPPTKIVGKAENERLDYNKI